MHAISRSHRRRASHRWPSLSTQGPSHAPRTCGIVENTGANKHSLREYFVHGRARPLRGSRAPSAGGLVREGSSTGPEIIYPLSSSEGGSAEALHDELGRTLDFRRVARRMAMLLWHSVRHVRCVLEQDYHKYRLDAPDEALLRALDESYSCLETVWMRHSSLLTLPWHGPNHEMLNCPHSSCIVRVLQIK
jgi:hypothetical protein